MIDIKHLYKAFTYSFAGLKHAWAFDQNIRIHAVIACFVIAASIILGLTPIEKIALGITILVVVTAEMVNTAIENMVDLITKEHREEARIAKDVSSGMVLITAVGSVVIGVYIFLPYLLRLL